MANQIAPLADAVRSEYNADIIVYAGPVARPHDDFLIDECPKKKKRKNVILLVATYGGDPHAAYRMARALQRTYCKSGKSYVYAMTVCASAGTLLATGADELILSEHAELGPIDPQLRRQDEVGERTSGLTPVQALDYLRTESVKLFREQFIAMRFGGLAFPTSVASRVAAEITSGCLGKLYEQIDPLRVAEINRTLSLAEHYGARLARNLKEGGLERLLRDYPAHDFVIDPDEAKDIFSRVSEPKECLVKLGDCLKPIAEKLLASPQAEVTYLEEVAHENTTDTAGTPDRDASEAEAKPTAPAGDATGQTSSGS